MKVLIAIIAVVAMVINAFFIFYVPPPEETTEPTENGNGENYIPPDFTVQVPDRKLQDVVLYDLHLFAQLYSENRSSGEWERFTLNAYGTFTNTLPDPVTAEDGYGSEHLTLRITEESRAQVTILVEESDAEPCRSRLSQGESSPISMHALPSGGGGDRTGPSITDLGEIGKERVKPRARVEAEGIRQEGWELRRRVRPESEGACIHAVRW